MTSSMNRGVLLDVDGTLLDSNDAHARAWVEVLGDDGIDASFERVRPLIGEGGDKLLRAVAGIDHESPRGKALTARRKTLLKEKYLPACRAFPGARALVARMREEGLRVVVATSAADDELDALLRAAGVADLIEHATTASDVARSKPDPDIVKAAIGRAGLPPSSLVMLGDTPYDVEAATRAEVNTIALRSGGWRDDALGGAIAIYDDVAELLARYETSPLAARG
jgi:HAD superfamily hydrolase (TIGR01509 family)